MNPLGVADYGMSVWDGGCFSLDRRLEQLKNAGFEGIEMLEAATPLDALHKAAQFRKKGMSFLTCNIPGSMESHFETAAALGCSYVWLNCGPSLRGKVPLETWIRRAGNFVECAADWGLKAALHNHLGEVVERQDELERFLEEVPEGCLLLDTGHLAAAGGNNGEIIRKYHDRLAAVHIKDVRIKNDSISPDAENWWDRLEFCEIGAGNIRLDFKDLFDALKEVRYDKWILIEQDTHKKDPVEELTVSRKKILHYMDV